MVTQLLALYSCSDMKCVMRHDILKSDIADEVNHDDVQNTLALASV